MHGLLAVPMADDTMAELTQKKAPGHRPSALEAPQKSGWLAHSLQQVCHDNVKLVGGSLRYLVQRGVADNADGRHRVDGGHSGRAVAVVVDHHVAWQHQPDDGILAQRSVRQRWVAGAEDGVGPNIDIQLFLQRCLNINFCQYAKTVFF